MMDCEGVREHVDAWALGALDTDDTREVERHLASCGACEALAREASETAAALALGVPLRSASASLKAKVLAGAAVLAEGRLARRGWRLWPAVAAAAIVAGAGLIAWAAYVQIEVSGLRDDNRRIEAGATVQAGRYAAANAQIEQMAEQRREDLRVTDAVTELVAQDDVVWLAMTGTEAAPGATGRYVWSRTAQMGALVARGLPALPEGKRYCLWLVYENDWVVGGLFDVDEDGTGRLIVRDVESNPAETGPLKGFAVSIESADGVTKHTGETVLRGSLE
jgi:hypothetical protein